MIIFYFLSVAQWMHFVGLWNYLSWLDESLEVVQAAKE
ncbi:Protein CBG27603 [Caenorhabditis briggsae]|uniref:Protein CBG27603 n=1 Tax=Caenorhabditis briggsae TaxID=6238 RepID=B6IKH3_CAEBR|nr:Protein CBG27603 [Caenorhabditis briggsae]CAS00403.1 Protein CBG27603 [Caenorhabditis briggsae]